MSLIQIHGLCKSFSGRPVLKDLSLNIDKGSSLVIMGGSGSGKSVLLKCILGLIPINGGTINVNNQETTCLRGKEYENYLKQFSMLFQGSALFDSLPIWENVMFGVRQTKKLSKATAKELAIEALSLVGLKPEVAGMFPSELSGGMQRRVAIARAMATKPEIIFFDEPTAGLDPIISNIINDLIVECSEKLGATSVTITHDINSAKKIAKQVAMLHNGLIIWRGDVKDLTKSCNPYVEQFIHGRTSGPIDMQIRS